MFVDVAEAVVETRAAVAVAGEGAVDDAEPGASGEPGGQTPVRSCHSARQTQAILTWRVTNVAREELAVLLVSQRKIPSRQLERSAPVLIWGVFA